MGDALQGIKVLDFSQVAFGPMCSLTLGDYGADVIKVEPLDGELSRGKGSGPACLQGENPKWLGRSRNKRSIAINLKEPEGKEIIYRLAKISDVLVENFRPGVIDRLGFGYDTLKQLNPRLIYASGSGYGRTGPYAHKGGQDRAAQAVAGTMDLNGEPDGPPIPMGASAADVVGGMCLAQGILLALLARERTSEGQRVDVSLLDSQLMMIATEANIYLLTGQPVTRNIRPLYDVYKTQDIYVMLIEYFHKNPLSLICSAMGIEDLSLDPRFDCEAKILANWRELRAILSAAFLQKPGAEWIRRFEEKDVICTPVNSVEQAFNDRQVIQNEMVARMQHPTLGEIKSVASPMKLSATPARVRMPSPLLGQHTGEILSELGYSQQEVQRLAQKKVVRQ